MIKFSVTNRLSGAVQFTAEIECAEDALISVKRGLAVQWALRCDANLRDADLRDANLRDADLSGANLGGAYLRGANLGGDKIAHLLASAVRLDGYQFFAFELEGGGVKILAGCRWFAFAEYRAHIAKEYPGTGKAAETSDILDFLEKRAVASGAVVAIAGVG